MKDHQAHIKQGRLASGRDSIKFFYKQGILQEESGNLPLSTKAEEINPGKLSCPSHTQDGNKTDLEHNTD